MDESFSDKLNVARAALDRFGAEGRKGSAEIPLMKADLNVAITKMEQALDMLDDDDAVRAEVSDAITEIKGTRAGMEFDPRSQSQPDDLKMTAAQARGLRGRVG